MLELSNRLSKERLMEWENLKYGMFIHFGMSTFVQKEYASGKDLSTIYAPTELDVDQWIKTAKQAGMKYAVLTAKHTSGHCLWPSKYTEYTIKTSSNDTDVVYEYMAACSKYGIEPGIYYCSWDNHHLFGSLTPNCENGTWETAYVTEEYLQFQEAQMKELLKEYKGIKEFWLDIPIFIPRSVRQRWYNELTLINPDMIYVSNNGLSDGSILSLNNTWTTDVITIEKHMPSSTYDYQKIREIEGGNYYLPGEVCETISKEWFYVDNDEVRSDGELLGIYLLSIKRGVNLLLDVPPDSRGIITNEQIGALMRLRKNYEHILNI